MRLGTDPEILLQDSTGKMVSVIGLINRGKWDPLQIPDMDKGFTLQEDNVAIEYGIPPASSADEFIHHIRAVLARSKDWLPGLNFSNLSCAVYPDDQLEHPMARVFGCEPDLNAWTGKWNPPPKADNPNLRSAGGHVHVETAENPLLVGQALDVFLGVPSVLMDEQVERRRFYGRSGAMRKKPYGMEYRTLSNFWVFDDKYIKWVWDNTERALGSINHLPFDDLSEVVQECINNSDVSLAQQLVDEFSLEVV